LKDLTAFQIKDYFDQRMLLYTDQVAELRACYEGLGAEDPDGRQKVQNSIDNLLCSLSEDNIVVTQVKLDLGNLPSLNAAVLAFREFIDTQRFIVKILADGFNHPYL